jgi:hypothetical protein
VTSLRRDLGHLAVLFRVAVLITSGGAMPLVAHSANQVAVLLDFEGASATVELQVPAERLASVLGVPVSQAAIASERSRISHYLAERVFATSTDGRHLSVETIAPPVLKTIEGAEYVVTRLRFRPTSAVDPYVLTLTSRVLTDRIPTQVALVTIRSDWRTSTFGNDPQLIGVLTAEAPSLTVDRRDGSWWRGFGSVLRLGVHHIAEGTDHLLFLLVLLLPSPLIASGRKWKSRASVRNCLWGTATVATAFTLGHSLTLAAGALDVVHMPTQPVEVLIAVSILVSAIHALRPLFPGREALIAGAFGLIHGLAFATTLGELGLRTWERAASLLAFNTGIELMQLLVVVAALPSLLLLSRTRLYAVVRLSGALFAGVAATGWIAQRLGGLPNPVNTLVTQVAERAEWVALISALVGAIAWTWENQRSHPVIFSTGTKENHVDLS